MSRRQLPPLHTLETFEVAAQHRSFKRAAEILHITPSAVSHQIRALEEHLGVELFRRMNRAIDLTSGGRAYLEITSQSLARLREGGQRVARQYGRNALKISMGPFIASEIVVPALPSFQREHPDVDIRIETSLHLVDLQHEDLDLVVRFGQPPWKGAQSECLVPIQVIPVCGAGLLQRYPDASPGNLKDVVLIHSDGNDVEILNGLGTLEALRDLKQQGCIRSVGISHKTVAGAERALALDVEVIMATLNRSEPEQAELIAKAGAQSCGVLIKKPLASGQGTPENLAWVAAHSGVSSIVTGTIDPDHLIANAAALAASG